MKPEIASHASSNDWCHLCGKRSSKNADVWWSENAEHDRGAVNQRAAVGAGRYVRICAVCAEKIVECANGGGRPLPMGPHLEAAMIEKGKLAGKS